MTVSSVAVHLVVVGEQNALVSTLRSFFLPLDIDFRFSAVGSLEDALRAPRGATAVVIGPNEAVVPSDLREFCAKVNCRVIVVRHDDEELESLMNSGAADVVVTDDFHMAGTVGRSLLWTRERASAQQPNTRCASWSLPSRNRW